MGLLIQKNTVEAYEEFIKRFPDSKLAQDAKNGITGLNEVGAWEKAKKVNTLESYLSYHKTYAAKYDRGVSDRIKNDTIDLIRSKSAEEDLNGLLKLQKNFNRALAPKSSTKAISKAIADLKLKPSWLLAHGEISDFERFFIKLPSAEVQDELASAFADKILKGGSINQCEKFLEILRIY